MNAEVIVYAFVGEIAFAAMAAGALLALAALLKVIPPEVCDSPDRLDEQKGSVMAEHLNQAKAPDHSSFAKISSYES
jgi:hypothetical protein